jgi:hypothetical protein
MNVDYCNDCMLDSKDAFGISYRPYRKPKPSYNMPSGPAFEDEAEFEKELMESSVLSGAGTGSGSAAAEDDEFDFEGDVPSLLITTAKATTAVVSTTANVSGGNEEGVSEAPGGDGVLGAEDVTLSETEGGSGAESGGPDKSKSVHDAAREALAEITGIYSSGLGDHEVTLLKDDEARAAFAAAPAGAVVSGGTIEEGDEEEFERMEEEEDRRQEEALSIEQRKAKELQMQWDAVERSGASAAASALTGSSDKPKSPSGRCIVSVKYVDAEQRLRCAMCTCDICWHITHLTSLNTLHLTSLHLLYLTSLHFFLLSSPGTKTSPRFALK